jgi:hypothetical protein
MNHRAVNNSVSVFSEAEDELWPDRANRAKRLTEAQR